MVCIMSWRAHCLRMCKTHTDDDDASHANLFYNLFVAGRQTKIYVFWGRAAHLGLILDAHLGLILDADSIQRLTMRPDMIAQILRKQCFRVTEVRAIGKLNPRQFMCVIDAFTESTL